MRWFATWSANLSNAAFSKLLISAFSIMVLGSGLLLALSMIYLRTQTLESASRSTDTFSILVAEQVSTTLQTVDERMRMVAYAVESVPSVENAPVQFAARLFQPHLEDMPFVRGMWLLDKQGNMKLSSFQQGQVSESPSIAQRTSALQRFQNSVQNFTVVTSAKNPKGEWLVYVAHAIRRAEGKLDGIIFAAIDSAHFGTIWQGLDLGDGGSVSFMSHRGEMLMRTPLLDKAMTTNYVDRPLFKHLIPQQVTGRYRDRSSVDGVERLFAYRTISIASDTVVVVGQTVEHALERWLSWVFLVSGTWLLGTLGTLFLCWFLIRSLAIKQLAEGRIAESERRYHSLFTEAMDAIFLAHPDGTILSANPAACKMLGYSEDGLRALGRGGILDGSDTRLASALAARSATGRFRGALTFVRQGGEKFEGEVSTSIYQDKPDEVGSIIIVRDISERKSAELQLREFAGKMQILSKRVIETQEVERRRIARELHDELGQSLTAIKINLQSGGLFTNQTPEDLRAENIHIVEDVLQQVRQLAMALRPSILDNLGLIPALKWLGRQTAARGNLIFEIQANQTTQRMPPELETTFFRIAQEALTNVLRHAQARHLHIRFERTEDHACLEIEDDGVGMHWESVKLHAAEGSSFGVLGMTERATLVGGVLTVWSVPQSGCRITFLCPLS